MKQRKYAFPTRIPFTISRLNEEAERVRHLGLTQVQFTCDTAPGLQAMIYRTGRITLYSRYCFQCRPYRDKLGELGEITLSQARLGHQTRRNIASHGQNPRQPVKSEMIYQALHKEHYLIQCRSRGKKSIHTDESRYRNWLGPAFGRTKVADITRTDVALLVVNMQESGISPATIRSTIGQLRTSLELAVDLGVIERNPTKGVRTPRVMNRRETFLTAEQVRAFCSLAQEDSNRVGANKLVLMALTGARLGEATEAKWEDVDLDAGVWHLPDQKSGRPGRIYLSEAAKGVIHSMEELRCNAYVFPGRRCTGSSGRPIRLFKRLCQKAGIPDGFRIHDLRHAWVSAGVNAGIPLEILSQGARHSTPTVTRLYSHAHADQLISANDAIARLFIAPAAA